jgi:nucleoid DNA-binding protein
MVARKRTTKRKPAARTTARKSPAKKTARKTTAKKTTAKKTTAKKATKKITRNAVRNAWTKSELLSNIADNVDLTKKQVAAVFDELTEVIAQHIKKGAAGEFTLPGLAKIVTKRKPATKARKGINPFTGEPTVFKAKPAKTVVKVRPLKKLKDVVA